MTNVTYEPIGPTSGTIPNATIIETETQISGAQRQVVKVGDTVTVTAAALPLPTGAATSAAQTDGSQVSKVLFDPSNMSAFGTLETAELTPIVQMDFVYGINTQTGLSTVANSATIDTNGGRLRLQSGTNIAGSAIFVSRRIIRYRAGQGITSRFTPVFTTGAASSTQIMGVGSATDGYFLGYNGTSLGILHRNGGSDTWTARANWNGDKLDGSTGSAFTYDPTKGTPVMIKYPYLGYGDIQFFMQHPTTGRWVLFHVIRYANTTAATQLSNPSLQFYAQVINSGNNTNLITYCGSVGIFISGVKSFIGNPKWAADSNKATITTETCLLNIKNCTTYNGVTNRGLIRLNSVSFGSTVATGIAQCRFKIGATIGGSPSYTPVNGSTADTGVTITAGNSIASVDVAGTTVGAGTYIYNITAMNGVAVMDLTPFEIYVAPGEILTISGFASSSSTLGVSVNWTEDI